MDFSELFKVAVAGVPLALVILGLVAFAKQMGASGKLLTGISMGIGLILGVGYQLTQKYPQTPADWFAAIVIGLAYGLIASGIYDALKLAAKADGAG